eukprot:scaffold38115_cov14-Tisochrysis_lutea.AAC.1
MPTNIVLPIPSPPKQWQKLGTLVASDHQKTAHSSTLGPFFSPMTGFPTSLHHAGSHFGVELPAPGMMAWSRMERMSACWVPGYKRFEAPGAGMENLTSVQAGKSTLAGVQ